MGSRAVQAPTSACAGPPHLPGRRRQHLLQSLQVRRAQPRRRLRRGVRTGVARFCSGEFVCDGGRCPFAPPTVLGNPPAQQVGAPAPQPALASGPAGSGQQVPGQGQAVRLRCPNPCPGTPRMPAHLCSGPRWPRQPQAQVRSRASRPHRHKEQTALRPHVRRRPAPTQPATFAQGRLLGAHSRRPRLLYTRSKVRCSKAVVTGPAAAAKAQAQVGSQAATGPGQQQGGQASSSQGQGPQAGNAPGPPPQAYQAQGRQQARGRPERRDDFPELPPTNLPAWAPARCRRTNNEFALRPPHYRDVTSACGVRCPRCLSECCLRTNRRGHRRAHSHHLCDPCRKVTEY